MVNSPLHWQGVEKLGGDWQSRLVRRLRDRKHLSRARFTVVALATADAKKMGQQWQKKT